MCLPKAGLSSPTPFWQVFVWPIKTSSDGDVCHLQVICADSFPSSPSAGFTLMSCLDFPFCKLRLLLFVVFYGTVEYTIPLYSVIALGLAGD